jgi:hypothetical protein
VCIAVLVFWLLWRSAREKTGSEAETQSEGGPVIGLPPGKKLTEEQAVAWAKARRAAPSNAKYVAAAGRGGRHWMIYNTGPQGSDPDVSSFAHMLSAFEQAKEAGATEEQLAQLEVFRLFPGFPKDGIAFVEDIQPGDEVSFSRTRIPPAVIARKLAKQPEVKVAVILDLYTHESPAVITWFLDDGKEVREYRQAPTPELQRSLREFINRLQSNAGYLLKTSVGR